jgi:hypothetical protein
MHVSSNRSLMLLLRTLIPPRRTPREDESETIPPFKHLSRITSIYLAPFGPKLDDLPTAVWTFELFSLASPHLKRLVFDFPFESLAAENDHLGVYRYLTNGLLQLTNLEELVFMNNDWNLKENWAIDRSESWWCKFSKLKRLSLLSPHARDWDQSFLDDVKNSLPDLETLVVRLHLTTSSTRPCVLDGFAKLGRCAPLKIVQVHNGGVADADDRRLHRVAINDPARVELHSMVVPMDHKTLRCASKTTVEFILQAAAEGSLWTREAIQHHGPQIEL